MHNEIHPNPHTTRLVHGALKRLEGTDAMYKGLTKTVMDHSNGQSYAMVIEMLLYAAGNTHGSTDHGSINGFFDTACEIEASLSKKQPEFRGQKETQDVNMDNRSEKLFRRMGAQMLSNHKTYDQDVSETAKERAEKKVVNALAKINTPLSSEISEISHSLSEKLRTKKQRINQNIDQEEKGDIALEIIAIEANLEFCSQISEMQLNWENFETGLAQLTESVQSEFSLDTEQDAGNISRSESRLQALSSLKSQLNEKARQRKNAYKFIYGDSSKPGSGIATPAITERRRRLSENILPTGEYEINVLSARELGEWLKNELNNKGVEPNVNTIKQLYINSGGDGNFFDEQIAELGFSGTTCIAEFVRGTYSVSGHHEHIDAVKAKLADIYVLELKDQLNIDLRMQHDTYIMQKICENVSQDDLVQVVVDGERTEIFSDFKTSLNTVLEYLNISEEDRDRFCDEEYQKIAKVMLSYHEITTNANDKHINPAAVVKNLSRAVFMNEPISLQTVRCLRWCYPDKVLEITPHGGDWVTKDTSGNQILRRESTEREKLLRWKKAVIDPINFHNIPIRDVTLLAAGDYDLIGPGFGYSENDIQSINARKYIEDLKVRVKSWGIFDGFEIRVDSFRDMISRHGNRNFKNMYDTVGGIFDSLIENHRLTFAGYNEQEIERLVNAEHETRIPFIEGWNRERSRALTKHKICMELSLSVLISQQQEQTPVLLTVSGTQPAALTFGRGHLIPNAYSEHLPITLFKSINDGQQPTYYQAASEVVT